MIYLLWHICAIFVKKCQINNANIFYGILVPFFRTKKTVGDKLSMSAIEEFAIN